MKKPYLSQNPKNFKNMAFLDIFKPKSSGAVTETVPVTNNDDVIREGESYYQYGLRICGRVNGSHPALTPYLSKIYHLEKRRQHQDEETQRRLQDQHQQELSQIEGRIAQKENQITGSEVKIRSFEDKITDARERLEVAKTRDGEINRMARIKLIIGSLILLILTIYLFIFYSSTFYSAFLYQPDPDSDLSLGSAMLNSRAYSEAFQLGFGSFIFIITAPIIFLGLGYSLHFFMVQKGGIKWFKIIALLFITLMFDSILAYKIGEVMYNTWAARQWDVVPEFDITMAIQDINSWAVIFCGFIVYLIWGIVFDMIMTAYEELRSNKHEITKLQSQISDYQDQINQLKQEIVNTNGEISALENQKSGVQDRINRSVLVDYSLIRSALSDFFAGWVSIMSALGHTSEEQNNAQQTYNDTINQLFQ